MTEHPGEIQPLLEALSHTSQFVLTLDSPSPSQEEE